MSKPRTLAAVAAWFTARASSLPAGWEAARVRAARYFDVPADEVWPVADHSFAVTPCYGDYRLAVDAGKYVRTPDELGQTDYLWATAALGARTLGRVSCTGETVEWRSTPDGWVRHWKRADLCPACGSPQDGGECTRISCLSRQATALGQMAPETADAAMDYRTDVALFGSGAEAAEHGLRDVVSPPVEAQRAMRRITRKRTTTREDHR